MKMWGEKKISAGEMKLLKFACEIKIVISTQENIIFVYIYIYIYIY